MPTVLVTGANRGLGLEFARQYAAQDWRVIATCRDPGKASALEGLGSAVTIHALDVTDATAVEALAWKLRRESIDIFINNAGIYGPEQAELGNIDYAAWGEVMRVNVMAPLMLCTRLLEPVARSELKQMAVLTSKMGSIGDNTSGGSYLYRSSKAALNAVMKSLAVDVKARGITVAILHPGWVRTDMGGPNALIDADESVTGMRQVLSRLTLEESGRFLDFRGNLIPW